MKPVLGSSPWEPKERSNLINLNLSPAWRSGVESVTWWGASGDPSTSNDTSTSKPRASKSAIH